MARLDQEIAILVQVCDLHMHHIANTRCHSFCQVAYVNSAV